MIFNDRCQPKYDTSDTAFVERMLVLPFRSKFLKTEQEVKDSKLEYKYLADPFISDKFHVWQPYILEWLLEGHMKYLQNRFQNIPDSCKDWREEVSAVVDNLEEWLEDNVEEAEDAVLELKDIKAWMPQSMKLRFKDKKHLVDVLRKTLKNYVSDTGKGKDRMMDVFRGYQLKLQSCFR
ncbi:uncharacterized protein SPPG_09035 [Spizellomyces punctatus DAOM BR117]|uniref:Uncharacterized protein n=1 Tax=Spizellomyces punctatus (strain DAOM BR117) TaxID=645134 RepID=A0A0L0HLW6_SPIPD|nr:uncharacterized protein SPPG_09035 [Spizellomyces punctatus DAOM BR117]KND02058.1 hypothetical protein SPPG_09035 [Spizellomyces punctatus DAOM BR117]|eukprot:XP_016610097.1 hypothetical protein SPPG_09035 [Spizellomyces punctatus DAOM BR117]